jgi:hypothetical protein
MTPGPGISGALLFGHYAFPPNRLGYCGPDDHQALFEYVVERKTDGGLLELERRFEGAFPYLRLIALANHIADPFDRRVVEAYWLGNRYLEAVDATSLYASLTERFKQRSTPRSFSWLTSKLELGAKPHHNFHVFDVYTHAGLMRDERATISLEHMDACRISWGQVISVEGPELVVARPSMMLREGKLALAEPISVRALRQLAGRGFADQVVAGSYVALHWNWVCQELSPAALARLRFETHRSLALANRTL